MGRAGGRRLGVGEGDCVSQQVARVVVGQVPHLRGEGDDHRLRRAAGGRYARERTGDSATIGRDGDRRRAGATDDVGQRRSGGDAAASDQARQSVQHHRLVGHMAGRDSVGDGVGDHLADGGLGRGSLVQLRLERLHQHREWQVPEDRDGITDGSRVSDDGAVGQVGIELDGERDQHSIGDSACPGDDARGKPVGAGGGVECSGDVADFGGQRLADPHAGQRHPLQVGQHQGVGDAGARQGDSRCCKTGHLKRELVGPNVVAL